jgi:hypothetical protein
MPKIVRSVCYSVAIIGAFASFAVPETALAQRPATPVEVVNPSTAPVPTTVLNPATQPAFTRSVDDPGRIAYQASLGVNCPVNIAPGVFPCVAAFSTVPTGSRLVIQQVSVRLDSADVTLSYAVGIVDNVSFFSAPGLEFTIYHNQPILAYLDGGNVPQLTLIVHGTDAGMAQGQASIMGYLLDCSATPCNPIAIQ